jgi:predicted Rossmann fold nucleotide-binding protein DprA/Smf involved in DNA uptake
MRVAVIGSKEFTDYSQLKSVIDSISGISVIISGGVLGTDTLARKYAHRHNIKFLEFSPDFKKHGNEAKHIRDRLIVEHCEKIIAFWDGECEGTKYTMDFAKQQGKPVKVIKV